MGACSLGHPTLQYLWAGVGTYSLAGLESLLGYIFLISPPKYLPFPIVKFENSCVVDAC